MKNLLKFSIWLVVILAIGLFASGCAETPWIDADDGVSTDTIVVEWGGTGMKTVTLYKTTGCPIGTSTVWANLGDDLTSPYTDDTFTPGETGGNVTFYKAHSDDAFAEFGFDPHDGGFTKGTVTEGTTQNYGAFLTSMSDADQCIHEHINSCYPDPQGDPGLGSSITWYGADDTMELPGAGGEATASFNQVGAGALAVFAFDNLLETCTNGTVFNGYQIAPVSLPDYAGFLSGTIIFNNPAVAGGGWINYGLTVMNKQANGGGWYVSAYPYTSGVEYWDWVPHEIPCPCSIDCDCCPPDEQTECIEYY